MHAAAAALRLDSQQVSKAANVDRRYQGDGRRAHLRSQIHSGKWAFRPFRRFLVRAPECQPAIRSDRRLWTAVTQSALDEYLTRPRKPLPADPWLHARFFDNKRPASAKLRSLPRVSARRLIAPSTGIPLSFAIATGSQHVDPAAPAPMFHTDCRT